MASDDHAAPNALRFGTTTTGFLGPNPVLPTPAPTNATGRVVLSLVPIDPSNNRGRAVEIEVEACALFGPEDDYVGLSIPQPMPTPPAPTVSNDSRCTFMPGSASPSTTTGVCLFALALLLVRRGRRDATRGAAYHFRPS